MFRTLLTVAILFAAANNSLGAIIVDVQDATMCAGSSSFIDVFLTGDPGDELGRFGYEFVISGATPQSGDLQFAVVQSNSEQTIGSSLPDHQGYVFLGDTDIGNWNSNRIDAVTLRGGDLLNSLDFVSINGTYLLARLELIHTGSISLASHNFGISLNLNPSVTEFDMDWDAGTNTNYPQSQITAFSGIVTINSAAVPEPGTFAVLAITSVGYIGRKWRRRTRTALQVVESHSDG